MSLASAYYAVDRYQNAQSNFDKYINETNNDLIDQYYDDYLQNLHSSNIAAGVSAPFAITMGWTFVKPIELPEFMQ